MEWQRWLAEPGPLLSNPHTCSPTWSGGGHTLTLSVLTTHCEWRSYSHQSEAAIFGRNATGNELLPWQPAAPTDDGRHARCSLTPCQRFPLERHANAHVGEVSCHGELGEGPAEALGWSLAPRELACPDCPLAKKPARKAFTGACRIIHHILWQ